MRITLDARLVGLPGIGRFISGLWGGLGALDADVVGLWPGAVTRDWLGAYRPPPAGHHIVLRARPFFPSEQAALPRTLRRLGSDVHHATHFNLPYATSVPIVLTVHDLIAYLDPSKARSRAAGAYYRAAFPRAVRRATAIVAVSAFTARQVCEVFGIAEDRVRVIESGVDHAHWRPRAAEEIAAVRSRFSLPAEYLLYVGTAKPHKNLATLFAAHRPAHPPLVLAGPTASELVALGCDPPSDGSRLPLGRVPDAVLPALYSGARALLLPSLHEGFGLTAVEAMACGTPVVASDGGALPDTVAGAGLVVAARAVDAWSAAIDRISTDDELHTELVRLGAERAAALAWPDCAQRYLDVYRAVAA